MSDLQQAQSVGGAIGQGNSIVDLDHANSRLPQAGDWLPADIAAIRRTLEQMYAAMTKAQAVRRSYVDVPVMLMAGVELEIPLDAHPYGYSQVAISALTAANIELHRETITFSFALTPGRFATIQQPIGTKITLKAGDPTIMAIFRYSDTIYGAVQP